ncbi:MAG: vWA domain-containing protein, partial [Spirochaetota bacterium]
MQTHSRKTVNFIILLSASLILFIIFPVSADIRTEKIDVFLVLDKSLSMEEEIKAVKEYIDTFIIDQLLIPGDFFVVIAFYGQAEIIISDEVEVTSTKPELKTRLQKTIADGRFTDIGHALDTLGTVLDKYKERDRKRYMLLITDGIQEAPETSKYYSPDGSFNHAFLENARTIQKEGWKIQILGIGSATAAKEIAKELSGGYTEISETPTKEELTEKTVEFLGRIEVVKLPSLEPVGGDGKSGLNLSVASNGYKDLQTVVIDGVLLKAAGIIEKNIIASPPFSFTINPGETIALTIPVYISQNVPSGNWDGNIIFTFSGENTFSPAVF